MKKNTLSYSLHLFTIVCISSIAFSQVGINTTDPKGILDINSTTLGVVYPNVSLSGTDDATTVVNPQGGAIVAGTVVYNTNTTNTGAITDIYPGVYVWDGTQWVVHYRKRQSELFDQTVVLRTQADAVGGYEDVPGLGIGDAKTFTAKYSGLYRIEVKTNFAGGRTETNGSIFTSMSSGQFRFLFDGTPYTFETSAFSAYSRYIGSGAHYEGIWKESYETTYVTLAAGQTYPFSLSFDAYDALGFIGNGSATAGPNLVDLISERFENYTVVNTGTTTSQCGTNPATRRWVTSLNNPCSACSGRTLYINSDRNSCIQSATARMGFTPSVASVDIRFDYKFSQKTGVTDSFRVYIHDVVLGTRVGAYLINLLNTNADTSYSGTVTLTPGRAYQLSFEYINAVRANYASVDNVVISELSGSPDLGRGYVGNEVDCQIEFTYIGE